MMNPINSNQFKLTICLCLTLISLVETGCSTVDGTGRRQLMLVSKNQEQTLGLQAYQEILSQETLSTDQNMTAIVRRVGERIAAVSNRPDFEWEFNLIESPQVNAFCLPGGKIAIYTGILPIMKNEAGMAVVMGHEVAHATARHGGERMSQSMGIALITELADLGLSDVSDENRALALAALGASAQFGVILPYSRSHELEADLLGLDFAARAGYDPREAVKLWERMKEASGGNNMEFFSTHPAEENRIKQLQKFMPGAMEKYDKAPNKYGLGENLQ